MSPKFGVFVEKSRKPNGISFDYPSIKVTMRFAPHSEDRRDTYPNPCECHFICNFLGLLQKYREFLAAELEGT